MLLIIPFTSRLFCRVHTFCLRCIKNFNSNKCPACNTFIFLKNLNTSLLKLIPESLYDKLKVKSLTNLNEIIEIKQAITKKSEAKLNEYSTKLESIRNNIKTETRKLITLLTSNEEKLLDEVNALENSIKKCVSVFKSDADLSVKFTKLKKTAEANSLNKE